MSTPPVPSQLSPVSLTFGESRASAHITSHATLGRSSTRASMGGRSNTIDGSSAMDLLTNLKEDDDMELGRKRSGAMRVFGRRSPSLFETGTVGSEDNSSHGNKHYIKMGILLSDDPSSTNDKVTQSLTPASNVLTRPSIHRTYTLPYSTSTTRSTALNNTPPNDQLTATLTETKIDTSNQRETDPTVPCPVSRPRRTSGGFELVDITQGDEEGGCLVVVQPSPPISVKSSSSNNTVHGADELQASSPDSGYGNTPDYVNPAGVRSAETSSESGVTDRGQSPNRTASRPLTRHRSGAIMEEGSLTKGVFLSEPSDEGRVRGDTDNSVYSVDSGEASPGPSISLEQPNMSSYQRPRLAHTMSVPDNLMAFDQTSPPVIPPDTIPEQGVTLPFKMSMVPTSLHRTLSEHEMGTLAESGTNSTISSSCSSGNFREMEQQLQRHAHHHVNPSQPTPQHRARVQTSSYTQKKWMEARKRKVRASSQPFAKSAEVKSLRSQKSGTLPSLLPDTKDYFQVTDELSKENSHFALSEALLSVIEQYKANSAEQQFEETLSPSSSPPVTPSSRSRTSSECTDVSQWRWSPAALTPLGSEHYLGSPISSCSGGQYMESPGGRSLESRAGSVSSVSSYSSMATSEGDFTESYSQRPPPQLSLLQLMQSPSWDTSAESTAQKLLQYVAGQLTGSQGEDPNFSQVVLKLPTKFLTSLQMDEDLQRSVITSSAHIRGNKEWAPPRKQIIYSMKQPSRNLQKDISAQGYRCTGCGMKVNPTLAKYFRFCNYTGKYFCQNCHTNATSIIPAHILERWSFKRLYVSNFARDLLAKINNEPVFTITSTHSSIYRRVPIMAAAKELRGQLIAVKQYLNTCRNAIHLNMSFQGYAPWTTDLHTYSIDDFLELKSGNKMKYLRSMLADAVSHIKSCPLCQGKGFVCEMCDNANDIIYPFELNKVSSCPECKCCFHKTCYSEGHTSCPRCLRMQQRLKQRSHRQAASRDEQMVKDHSGTPS